MEVDAPDKIPPEIRKEARRHYENADSDFTPKFRQFVHGFLDEEMPYEEDALLRIKLEALAAEMRPPLGEDFTLERAFALLCVLRTAQNSGEH